MKDSVKQKEFLFYWKPGSQNMGDYFIEHNLPHHHREFCATYFYMANEILKIDHKVMQEWANSVLTPNHTVALTPNHKVVQDCDNVVRKCGHTKPTTLT